MPKKLLAILIISVFCFATNSCQSFKNTSSAKNKEKEITNQADLQDLKNGKKENFETLQNEDQAEAIDKKTQQEIEEVEVKDRVFFSDNSYELNEEARSILDTQTEWLKSDNSIKIIVEGHCDERGTREYNIALGERRANSVKKYLISNGISSGRIKIISYGKERPAFFGSDSTTMAKNRRVVSVPQN